MSSIKVSGVGGLGMIALIVVMAFALPAVRWLLLVALAGGVIGGLAVAWRRRAKPEPPHGPTLLVDAPAARPVDTETIETIDQSVKHRSRPRDSLRQRRRSRRSSRWFRILLATPGTLEPWNPLCLSNVESHVAPRRAAIGACRADAEQIRSGRQFGERQCDLVRHAARVAERLHG